MEGFVLFLVVVMVAVAAACYFGRRGSATGSGRTEDEAPRAESEVCDLLPEAGRTGEKVLRQLTAMAGYVLCQLVLVFLFLWAAGGTGVRTGLPLALFLVLVGGTVLVGGRRQGAA